MKGKKEKQRQVVSRAVQDGSFDTMCLGFSFTVAPRRGMGVCPEIT